MNIFSPSTSLRRNQQCVSGVCAVLIFLFFCSLSRIAHAQVDEEANYAHPHIYVGAGVAGFNLQYGDHNNVGPTVWVDADTTRRFGVEGEGRWLEYRQTMNVHAETYLGGARYHFNYRGRFQPYVKFLIGQGKFNFPYNYATGSYFVFAPGGGVDYALTRRWRARADFEYQDWPQFTFGTMKSTGITLGMRYRIF